VTALAACALALVAAPARAEVVAASPTGFVLRHNAHVQADSAAAWRGLGKVGRWWSDAHTYSGAAANMTLAMRAGGCFCERWQDGSVEHGRVIMAMTDAKGARTLRLLAPLGPLQELAVTGVLTFTISSAAGGSDIVTEYRVVGDGSVGLDAIAPNVDSVQGEQLARFERYLNTGAPE